MTDMAMDGWLMRRVPAPARPYLLLMRLDRPIGTWLLLLPCWWSVALASPGLPPLAPLLWFAVGAVLLRGAGCTINDLFDRDFDRQVARTAHRPLASGAISPARAWGFLGGQLLAGLAVLVQFNGPTILLGAAALLLVFPYPLMKRITHWPQAWLGLTFNWGALLGWMAVRGDLAWPPVVLYAAGVLWTLGYDTIYAHQDKADDIKVGVKSLALRLGSHTRTWLWGFYGLTLAGLAAAGVLAGLGGGYLLALVLPAAHLVWQVATVDCDDSGNTLRRFRSNRDFGLLVFAALVIGQVTV